MKSFIHHLRRSLCALALLISTACLTHAQAPQSIPYQGVARNLAGNILGSQPISLRLSIHDVIYDGLVVYSETHYVTTTSLGLFNVNIGQGSSIIGTLSGVNWGTGAKYLEVELDPAYPSFYTSMGTTQLNSVPYALFAGNSAGLPAGSANGNTMRWNGTAWVADSALFNDGTNVGIGTATPAAKLDVAGNVKISDGTQGAGKVLKSNATGLASWGTLSGTDLLSTPIAPCVVVAGSVATGSRPHYVDVSGNFAYVVNFASGNMQVINISNPNAPVVSATLSAFFSPVSISVAGNYAYVSDIGSGELKIIDITTPTSPSYVSSITSAGLYPRCVAVQGNYAYVVNQGNNKMQIIDITNKAAPALAGFATTGSTPVNIAIAGNYAYVSNYSGTMDVIDISNPATPVVMGTLTTGSGSSSVVVSGNYAYVVNQGSNNLMIIDITTPSTPAVIGTVTTASGPVSVSLSGNYAYVANNAGDSMQVINISNPAAPSIAGSVPVNGGPLCVKTSGNYAYVVSDDPSNTLQVINLACSQNFSLTVDPGTGLTTAIPYQWNTSGNNMSNANTGNVGIGTATPAAKLEVAGQVKITGGAPALGKVLTSDGAGLATWQTPTGGIAGGTAAGNTPYWNGTSWIVNSSNIYNNGGNVGIGTITPTSKLDVEGGLTVGTTYSGTTASPSNGAIIEGNVGIGTVSPSAKLDINKLKSINTTTPGLVHYNLHLSAPQSGVNDSATGITFGTTNNLNAQAGIYVQNSNAYGTKMFFGTTNSFATGSQTRMTIDNIGNIGIGTTNPSASAKLEVAGQVKITGGNPGLNKVLTSDATGLASWVTPSSGLANGTAAGNTPYWNGSSWVTSSSNIFNNGGNVGIGTPTPGSKLEVVAPAGGTKTLSGSSSATTFIGIGRLDAEGRLAIAALGGQFSTSASAGDIVLRTDLASQRLILNNGTGTATLVAHNGNVGIGIENPPHKLDVHSSSGGATIGVGDLLGANPLLYLSGGTSTCDLMSRNNHDITFTTFPSGAAEQMRIKGNGNVGIGTPAPVNKLDVEGGLAIGASYSGTNTAPANGAIIQGFVGIGTSTSNFPLTVSGSATAAPFTTANDASWFGPGTGLLSNPGPPITWSGVSIYANGWIASTVGIVAHSDIRIKNIKGISNTANDLQTLSKLEITDYTMRDFRADNSSFKKIIAQQVASVYPQAVKKTNAQEFIANLYQLANTCKVNGNTLTIDLSKPIEEKDYCDVVAGAKIKLYLNNKTDVKDMKQVEGIIESVYGNTLNITLKEGTSDCNFDKVFVYGTKVNDILSVDYEALSTLNISATQELYKMISDLKAENEKLKIENGSFKTDVEKLKAENATFNSDIEKIKAQLGMDIKAAK